MKMKAFTHPNVLALTGVTVDHHFSPCIIMPFMENGSLDKYLQKEEHRLSLWFLKEEPTVQLEVVSAMWYVNTCKSFKLEQFKNIKHEDKQPDLWMNVKHTN